jgi:hypothetical protein
MGGQVIANVREKRKQGSPGAGKLRKVCRSCNNGWMKTLEEVAYPVAEPIILGGTPQLGQEQQLQLAKLATNIAFVGEYLGDPPFISEQGRRGAFKANQMPPDDLFIFIGRAAEPINDPKYYSHGLETLRGDAPGQLIYKSFTAVMGSLLIHGVTMGEGHGLNPRQYCANLGLAPVWPYLGTITMSLMPLLTNKQILELRYVIQNELGNLKFVVLPKPKDD